MGDAFASKVDDDIVNVSEVNTVVESENNCSFSNCSTQANINRQFLAAWQEKHE